jgi:NTP pyrophosphatase (non-canonical NTP hydrolase)
MSINLKSGIELRMLEWQQGLYEKTKVEHHKPGQNLKTCPAETIELRKNLIREEVQELLDALDERDPKHALKEICDSLVVIIGTVVTFDLPMAAGLQRVHLNNMEKLETGTVREDGKLVKHPNHPKVDFEDLFHETGAES